MSPGVYVFLNLWKVGYPSSFGLFLYTDPLRCTSKQIESASNLDFQLYHHLVGLGKGWVLCIHVWCRIPCVAPCLLSKERDSLSLSPSLPVVITTKKAVASNYE